MKKIICLFLFALPSFVLSAQTNVDSLVNVLETQKLSAEQQLDLYYNLYDTYVLYDLEKATEYAKEGLALAKKGRNKVMMSKLNSALGRIYDTKSSYDTALVYYKKALDLAMSTKDKELEANAYSGIGILYARQEKFIPALEYFKKALSILENLGNKRKCMITMANMASLHRGLGNRDRVKYYLEKSKNIAEEINDANGKMQIYFELGVIYSINKEEEKIGQALEYELKAYEISCELENKVFQAAITEALSAIYSDHLKDYDMALKYAQESLQFAKQMNDSTLIYGAWNAISNAYRVQKRYKESEEAALNAWRMDSTKIHVGINILENIVLANIVLGNKDKASFFFHEYIDVIKKHIDQSSREILANMEVKYETEKKETRISILEEEQKLYIGLGIAVVTALLLGLGFLFYYHHSRRKIAEQQIKQLKQEKELIATRSALKAEKTEREIIARDLHDGVGAMLSVVKNNMDIMKSYSIIENAGTGYLNMAMDVLDKSITELRRVSHHIMPSILIEEGLVAALDDFCRSIPEAEFHCAEPDCRFDPEKELVIYRCAYELINNALRHANSSHIEVHLNMDEELVYLSVVDDGHGFDPQSSPMGMGISNMRTRISIFGGRIDIHSELEKGTEVNIELGIKGDYPLTS